HRVAAVLSPRTLAPSRKIRPAPRKPIPETTWAATRVGLASPGTRPAKITKVAAPSATSELVRRPARRFRHWRSNPMMALSASATARLIAAWSIGIVIADGSYPMTAGTNDNGAIMRQHQECPGHALPTRSPQRRAAAGLGVTRDVLGLRPGHELIELGSEQG